MLAPGRHGRDAPPTAALAAEDDEVEISPGAGYRSFIIESGTLLAEKIDFFMADLSELRRLSTEQLLDERYQRLMSFGYC